MSDHYMRLIPVYPDYIPATLASEEARQLLASFVPCSDEIYLVISNEINFIDPGSNWERLSCPLCGSELDISWWQAAMDIAYETKFTNLVVDLPCCHNKCSLNDLKYEWAAGFARFVLEVRNPSTDLIETQIHALEQKLGCTLRKIWTHY